METISDKKCLFLQYTSLSLVLIGGIAHCVVDICSEQMINRLHEAVIILAGTIVLIVALLLLQKAIKKDVPAPAIVTLLIGVSYIFRIIWHMGNGFVGANVQEILFLSVITAMVILNIIFSFCRKYMNILIVMQAIIIAVYIGMIVMVFISHADEVQANWDMDKNDYTTHLYVITLTCINVGLLLTYINIFLLEKKQMRELYH